ncbi:hypothetical protein BRADI_2g61288v3 [Brachypodium distachyon]|uniref:KIB1-4 beta-propeller domain-containing protein n=1 Tax=Brachypodium distachyon TaxID=15368 RepID=A0A0Q3REJ8_BRADI|nr:hypothetical protein BRADI_2g61288v3 [Brachypodium distachyon]
MALLADDLLRKIGESFLETSDLDYYINFRAATPHWRRATGKPTADGDPRFMPRNWIMLEREDDDGFLTFVNLSTGRFLRKRLPCLRDYFFVGAATGSGHLVVGERAPPYQTRVINPFTGTMVEFMAPIPLPRVETVVVTFSPMMVFISDGGFVQWADQNSESFQQAEFLPRWARSCRHMTTLFAGQVYVTTGRGAIASSSIVEAAGTEEEGGAQVADQNIVMDTAVLGPPLGEGRSYDYHYLVESEGELLLVRGQHDTSPVVYKVDLVNKVLVPLRSIGGRALFLSDSRCFSIDAGKFHTIEASTIYYAYAAPGAPGWVHAYDYDQSLAERDTSGLVHDLGTDFSLGCCCRPFTFPELLTSYLTALHDDLTELERVVHYGDEYYGYGNDEADQNDELLIDHTSDI